MGSGHFLTSAVDYLAREIIDAQEKQAAQEGIETVNQDHDINWARRQVAQRCIYGVDLNPLAVELAKVSLWLRTLAAEQPLAFLDHHLKTGNSLVGSDIEDIDELESDTGDNGEQGTTLADFGIARKGTIEQLMRIYQDFIAIENQDLDDIKEMEAKYDEFERNKLRQRLEALANIKTAEDFGLTNVPKDAYEKLSAALEDDDEWVSLEETDWFQNAQQWAAEDKYFHWRLEYPEAFYNESGVEIQDPGFDAVIGNPPWMDFQRIGDDERGYQRKKFESAIEKYDLYVAFVEQAVELLKPEQAFFGYIIQNKFLSSSYGEGLKEFLDQNVSVRSILDFEDANVFAGTTTYPLILLLTGNNKDEFEYAHLEDATGEDVREFLRSPTTNLISSDRLSPSRPWIFPTKGEAEVVDTLRNNNHPILQDIAEDISTGIKTNLKEAYVFEKGIKDIPVEKDLLRPVLDGGDIGRYSGPRSDKYIIYPYEESGSGLVPIDLSEYPKAREHFLGYEEELSERLFYEKTIEEMGKEWFEFPYTSENLLGAKILFPDISTEPRCTFDSTGETLILNTAYGAVLKSEVAESVQYVCALFNSSPLRFMFTVLSPKLSGGYYRFQTQYVGQLPIPSVLSQKEENDGDSELLSEYEDAIKSPDDFKPERFVEMKNKLGNENRITHDFLSQLAERMMELQVKRDELNLHIIDYLGDYQDGMALSDISGYQPAEGVFNTSLSKTSEDLEGLRVGGVRVEEKASKLVILATARYKPDNEEEVETDQWGYTETEFHPAIELVGLDDQMGALVKEFVPFAVEEAGGFANFREQATTTNSLVDRLGNTTLPALSDIESEFERYLDTRERAELLNSKINKTDILIDMIAYKLYDLSEEEIRIVESSLEE